VKTFRKPPVEIQAIQFTGETGNVAEILAEVGEGSAYVHDWYASGDDHMVIDTLEGKMIANLGDWIIKGVQGEFYPCKPDIFEQTYEAVEETA
jgi:hypothetical protein